MKSLLILLVFICSFKAFALSHGDIPLHVDDYVNDFGGLVGKTDADAIRRDLKRLKYQTGISVVVVTIPDPGFQQYDEVSIEGTSLRFFNEWGIGQKDKNDGILILISKADRRMRIEPGDGWGGTLRESNDRIIRNIFTPSFMLGNYSKGIREGVHALIDGVTSMRPWYRKPMYLVLIAIVIVLIGVSLVKSGKQGAGWFLVSIGAVILVYVIKLLFELILNMITGSFGGGSSSGGGGSSGQW